MRTKADHYYDATQTAADKIRELGSYLHDMAYKLQGGLLSPRAVANELYHLDMGSEPIYNFVNGIEDHEEFYDSGWPEEKKIAWKRFVAETRTTREFDLIGVIKVRAHEAQEALEHSELAHAEDPEQSPAGEL